MTDTPLATAVDKLDRLLAELGALLRDALLDGNARRHQPPPDDPEADAIDPAPLSRFGAGMASGFTFAPPPAPPPPPLPAGSAPAESASSGRLPAGLSDEAIEKEADRIGQRTALGTLAQIKQNPRLADVVAFLLTPLVEADLMFDGNAEAILTRRANEFSAYTPRQLSAAARHLCNGRHTHFPEADEIYAAIGKNSRPGLAGDPLTKAA